MSKNYQKAAIRRIFALAVLIAGTCYIAATAWATTCFLPSGNCSTGRVGNEDGGGEEGGDESNPGPGTQEDACKDFTNNTTQTEYNWKNTTSCFKCTTCTSNGNTKYNCVKNSGYSWDSSDGGHCCVSGEKWYSKMGTCCSATSGCTCPTLQKWNNGECVCQYAKTSTGTCCEKDKIADKHLCCNAGEHAENTICCPANKHEQNGSCVCDANYETDGTGCKPIDKCKGYDLTASQAAQYNNNCYTCSQCDSNAAKYKCTQNIKSGYKLENGVCKEVDKPACTYEYARIDTSDTHGDGKFSQRLQTSFELHKGNTRGAGYYWKGPGSHGPYNTDFSGYQMYSKIDKNSKSCQKGYKTAYETICPGTARVACSRKFVPNGCSSEQYVVDGAGSGLTVESMDFGDCNCDYDTKEACLKGIDRIYPDNSTSKYYECEKSGSCYDIKVVGFEIHAGNSGACGGWSLKLIDAAGRRYENGNGIHEAGNYSVVINKRVRDINCDKIHYVTIHSVQDDTSWCFGDHAEDTSCEKSDFHDDYDSISKAYSFKKGFNYIVSVTCF